MTHRPMEQNREFRINSYKYAQLIFNNPQRKHQGGSKVYLRNGFGKTDTHMQEEETELLFHIIYKNQLKMD